MTATMRTQDIATVMTKPISQQLLGSSIPARFASTGLDGDPRVVPVGFDWDGTRLTVATVLAAAKVKALQANPKVAITIDTQSYPPQVLLIRGAARVEIVDGVPDAYVRASKKVVPPEGAGKLGGRCASPRRADGSDHHHPSWAKLLDFETTLPKAVEDLIRARTP
jgi:Pyridoxamine 5'-phosphate oxidase